VIGRALHVATKCLKSEARSPKPAEGLVPDGRVEQLARERDELLEPQRLIAELGAEVPNLVRLGIVQIVIAGDDGDWGTRQTRDGSNGAQELETARQRHAQVEDHGMGPMSLGEVQPFIGRQRRPDLVSFETKHSRKCVGYAYVVINDEHTRRGFGIGGRRRHRRHYAIFSHFGMGTEVV